MAIAAPRLHTPAAALPAPAIHSATLDSPPASQQLPAQLHEHARIRASLHRPHIPGRQPGQQLHISRADESTGPDLLVTGQHLKTGAIDNQASHHVPAFQGQPFGTTQLCGNQACQDSDTPTSHYRTSTAMNQPKARHDIWVSRLAAYL